jgi:hypothetical protein
MIAPTKLNDAKAKMAVTVLVSSMRGLLSDRRNSLASWRRYYGLTVAPAKPSFTAVHNRKLR